MVIVSRDRNPVAVPEIGIPSLQGGPRLRCSASKCVVLFEVRVRREASDYHGARCTRHCFSRVWSSHFQESRGADDRVASSALDPGRCAVASTTPAFTGLFQCIMGSAQEFGEGANWRGLERFPLSVILGKRIQPRTNDLRQRVAAARGLKGLRRTGICRSVDALIVRIPLISRSLPHDLVLPHRFHARCRSNGWSECRLVSRRSRRRCVWSRCSPTATRNGDFRRSRHRTQGRAQTPVNTGDNGLPKSPGFGQSIRPELRKPNKTGVLYRFLLRAVLCNDFLQFSLERIQWSCDSSCQKAKPCDRGGG